MLELRIARIEWTAEGEVTTPLDVVPPCRLLSYVPQPVEEAGQTQVEERLRLALRRDAPDWLRTLNATLERARYWSRTSRIRRDLRTVLLVRDDRRHGRDEWYEAPLYDGYVDFTDSQGRVVDLRIVRGAYWMGNEVLCPVLNTGTDLAWADQATIYNHDDDMPGHNNWVLVKSPAGDAPTPARLLIHNTYDSGRLRKVYIGWYNQPQQLTLDVKDAGGATLLPDNVAYSYNKRGTGSQFTWEIENNAFKDFTGMFKVLANGNLSNGTWQIGVGYEVTKLQQNAAVPGQNGWTDLGNVMLPAGLYAHPERYPLRVWLTGSESGILDFLLFMPVSWETQLRELIFHGYNAQNGTCIEDNGWRQELVYVFGQQRVPVLYSFGQPVYLQPEGLLPQALPMNFDIPNAQMLSFALENDSGRAEPLRTAQIQVFARPFYGMLP